MSRLALRALGIAVFAGTLATGARADELPIVDVHSHTARGLNPEDVVVRMDSAGVRKIVLFARRQGSDDDLLRLHANHPDRVVPAVGFQTPGWLRQIPRFLEVEAKLKSGRFRWMGELLLRHYGVPELAAAEYDVSPDNALFRRVLDLSARYGAPVTIHHEAEPADVDLFRRVLAHNREALVVWAHWCGRGTPDVVRAFLKDFPSLFCDLGASDPRRRYGREKNPLVGDDGRVTPEWTAVIQEFPDRFLAAIDAVDPSHYDRYVEWVRSLRTALRGLHPDLARAVASENAERLLARWKAGRPAPR